MALAELWRLSAAQVVDMLKQKQITPLQLVEAAEARWKATDPVINAMPITCWERAKEKAALLMAEGFPVPAPISYLYGLPIAVKDVTAVKGLPFTEGSLLFKDRVADHDDPMVQQLELNGAIIVGKTNTPEFAAGSQTYNKLFGATLNPWDISKTAGGSSGGSAAAVAVGQVWLATGSDLGGSLRNPASFCGVVGLRPSIGFIPQEQPPALQVKDNTSPQALLHSVNGLVARTVEDLAMGLDAAAGQHPEDAWSLPPPQPPLSVLVALGYKPHRVAFTPDLGGITPVDPEVAAVCRAAAGWWCQQGAELTEDSPNLQSAPQVFQVLRALRYTPMATRYLSDEHVRQMLKEELIWQGQQALNLQQDQVDWAVAAHRQLMLDCSHFFQHYDLLLCPTVMLPPFDVSIPWISDFRGQKFDNYVEWLRSCSAISLLGGPAVSVPCGTTSTGLPVGLQIVGAPGTDAQVLAAARLYEKAHQHALHEPKEVVQHT